MKKLFKSSLLLFIALLVISCGNSPAQFVVSAQITSDGQDPRARLKDDGGRIIFQFEELNSSDITDINSSVLPISYPTNSNFDPASNSFDITGAPISDYKLYRVSMLGVLGPAVPYTSLPSCAYQKALGSQNKITLCFGLVADVAALSSCTATAPCPTYLPTTASTP